MHERALEHQRDANSFCPKSHIIKHWMISHPEQKSFPPMTFRATTLYKDCLSRQIGEALRILYSKDRILNSKSEYLHNTISRLTIEEDTWERKERSRKEEEQELIEKLQVEEFRKKKEKENDCEEQVSTQLEDS